MTTYLLDSSVLIPLLAREHVHHERVSGWASSVRSFATCPIVEGAVVRFSVRLGARAEDVQAVLALVRARPGFAFWADSLSYAEVDLGHVRGHRQVTDAYLAGLAQSRGGVLATLDVGLAQECPQSTFLLPG